MSNVTRSLDHPPPLPLPPPASTPLGNLWDLHRRGPEWLSDTAQRYGDVVPLAFPRQRTFLVSSPDLVERVLVTRARDYLKSPMTNMLRPLIGDGLVVSEGDVHKANRQTVQGFFDHAHLERYGEVMREESQRLLDGWRSGGSVDISEAMTYLTLRIVGRCLFGTDVGSGSTHVSRWLDVVMGRADVRVGLLPRWSRHIPSSPLRRIGAAEAALHAYTEDLIAKRRVNPGGEDLLSALVAAAEEAGWTDRQVRDEAVTMLLAGHETTATALTWAWALIAEHPDVRTALQQEVDRLDGPAGWDDLPRLPYTRQVLAATMRLRPPVWTIERVAVRPTRLGPAMLERGDTALLSQWVLHHDPRWWPEPDRFDPTRFAPGDGGSTGGMVGRPKFAYFPFGGGSRLCIGDRFAWAEGTLILANLAADWELWPTGPLPRHKPRFTLRPAESVRMTTRRR